VAGLVSALALGLLVTRTGSPSEAVSAPPRVVPVFATPPTSADKPRLAFTDDRDQLVTIAPPVITLGAPLAPVVVKHAGEASFNQDGGEVFVSTAAGDSHGDVYLGQGDGDPLAVTCNNSDVETHPVLSPDGLKVAYASNHAGNFDIWVADLYGPAPPSGATVLPCSAMPHYQVTTNAADDLWPSWDGSNSLVFSSTRDDPLGDIYSEPAGTPNAPPAESSAVRLTQDPPGQHFADTQPAVGQVSRASIGRRFVAFTTTRYRTDGSLAVLPLPRPGDTALPRQVTSLWPPSSGTPQSSEAAWSPDNFNPDIAYTTTQDDPWGDVRRVPVDSQTNDSNAPLTVNDVTESVAVATTAGVAESHGAWQDLGGDGSDPTLVVTSRSHDADVSDVVAVDGSGRRTIAASTDASAQPFDEAGPNYSPDGTRIAYSRAPAAGGGRELVTAKADGTNIAVLPAQRQPLDVDIDPVWSPDDTRIAFTRLRAGHQPSAIWVVDISTSTAHSVTTAAPIGYSYFDEQPSWSPDGKRLAVTRHVLTRPDLETGLTANPTELSTYSEQTTTLTATVTNNGPGPAKHVRLTFDLRVTDDDPRLTLTDPPNLPAGCSALGIVSVTCDLGTMDALASLTRSIEAQEIAQGSQTVLAAASTDSSDFLPSNNEKRIAVGIDQPPGPPDTSGGGTSDGSSPPPPPIIAPRAARPDPDADSEIWTIDAATGVGTRLTVIPPICPGPSDTCFKPVIRGRSPAWSPDGLQIAYDDNGSIKRAVLIDSNADHVADIPERAIGIASVTGFQDDGTPTPSRPDISVAEDPAWSPDGSEIAIAGQPAGQPDQRGIYALKPDGTGLRDIAQQRQPETEPAWQPYTDVAVTLTPAPAAILVGATTTLIAKVTNNGPARAANVRLSLTIPPGLVTVSAPAPCATVPGVVNCSFGTLAKGETRTVPVVARGTVPGPKTPVATVLTDTPDVVAPNNQATTTVLVTAVGADVAVALSLSKNIGYVGGTNVKATITVTNHGPQTATGVSLRMTYPAHVTGAGPPTCLNGGLPCALGVFTSGTTKVLHASLTLDDASVGDVVAKISVVTMDPVPGNNVAKVKLTVKKPTLRMLPPIGSPGFVTLAYGVDFPPGENVLLTWLPGINSDPGPFPVIGDGTFRQPVLIIRRDELGNRVLKATPTTPGLFGAVTAPMLVVPRTMSPPRFLGRG
jgi:uncharacterized repeat protein (TIGR01451 family)